MGRGLADGTVCDATRNPPSGWEPIADLLEVAAAVSSLNYLVLVGHGCRYIIPGNTKARLHSMMTALALTSM